MEPKLSLQAILQRELQIWQSGALPGLAVVGLIVLLRLTGGLQVFEWMALDTLLRLRSPEPIDEHILIVGVDEDDLQSIKEYPIPDGKLAELIQTLRQDNPALIGLDIFRDLPQGKGHAQLETIFRTTPNLIGIETVSPRVVAPPPALPDKQVGFADFSSLDTDGKLRRSLLATYNVEQTQFRYSFATRIAEQFLGRYQLLLQAGNRDPYAMRFGAAELPRVQPNTGGYRNLKPAEVETLLNFRSGSHPFRMVSMRAVLAGQVPATWVRDRIVLIGMVAPSVKDIVNSVAVSSIAPHPVPGIVYGVEVHAHAVSQITQAALDGRPLLYSWAEGWEYIWIIGWGLLGIGLGRVFSHPWHILSGLGLSCFVLLGSCYALLLVGCWVPLVPALSVLFLNSVGLTASLFYRYQQDLKRQLRDRQHMLEYTFDAIHSGPLQTLSQLLSQSRSSDVSREQMNEKLEILNRELRAVYESVKQEVLTTQTNLHLAADLELNLDSPLHEVLYEVYIHTLEREFECFKTIKFCVTTFDPLNTTHLTMEQKRGLCRFLEEALCNVGKYAIGVTRLDVACTQQHGWNIIRVTDNGKGLSTSSTASSSLIPPSISSKTIGGRGTQFSHQLAQQLGGHFRREPMTPCGTYCELKWNTTKLRFWW